MLSALDGTQLGLACIQAAARICMPREMLGALIVLYILRPAHVGALHCCSCRLQRCLQAQQLCQCLELRHTQIVDLVVLMHVPGMYPSM